MSAQTRSTRLIEFPGTSRSSQPQWRKELSERVREIQERKAREAALEAEAAKVHREVPSEETEAASQLELVPSNENVPVNPVVIAALRRLERARQAAPPKPKPRVAGGMGSQVAATAVARAIEEPVQQQVAKPMPVLVPPPAVGTIEDVTQEEIEEEAAKLVEQNELVTLPVPTEVEKVIEKREEETRRQHNLVVVPLRPVVTETPKEEPITEDTNIEEVKIEEIKEEVEAVKIEAPVETAIPETPKKAPRKVFEGVLDDTMIAKMEAQVECARASMIVDTVIENRAAISTRVMANLIDLALIGFLASPFAAIIQLINGNWGDIRIAGSMLGILLVIMYLYFAVSAAFAGRTWGMSLMSIHIIEARTGLIPTTGQAFRRAFIYVASLVTLGLGILFALIDPEGRAAHDHLSGTVVVRE
jgi:uncharacterized RDD family membrane protein YckC